MPYNTVSDTESLAGIAKEMYPIQEIKDMEQRVTNFKKEVEDDSELNFSAKNDGSFIFPVKASGAHGQKMINQKEGLPHGKPSNIVQGTAFVKEYAGVIEFTKRELELAKKNPASFADAKTLEMESLIENAHKYFNRQIANGDGHGIMTLVTGVQTSATINVVDATPFQIGMVLDLFNAANTVKLFADIVVEDVDILSNPMTVTFDQVVTTEDQSPIYIAGVNDNAATDGKEMSGMPLVTDDGSLAADFQGIVRQGAGEVPNYRGIQLDANGGPISESLVAQLLSRAFRIGGVEFNKMNDVYWLISPEQWRVYASLAIPQIRFAPNDKMDLAKGYGQDNSTFEIAGKRAVLDTDVARDRAYIIKKDTLKMAIATQLDWEEDLGGTSLKWLSGYAQGIMVLYALEQFFSSAPRECAAVINLATVNI